MTALDLHNALFTSDKRFVNANVTATPTPTPITRPRLLSLTTVQEHDPTFPTFNTPTFHDLLSRQPLHPDGPRHWDLGLDLTGDPPTAAECKSLEDRITKSKLRRLQWICVIFEVVIGIWSIYCTIRYSLAFQTTFMNSVRTLALVLCVSSGISVAGVMMTLFMPLLPKSGFVRAARMVLRACFVVLIFATAIVNLVFVLIWRPVDRCGWDMDVSWSGSVDSSSPHCRTASLAAWTIAASLRIIATLIMILLYLYFLRAYFEARHPSRYTRGVYYPPLMASEDVVHSPVSTIDSPVSTIDPSSSRTHFNKLIRSQAALGRSSSTLALTNSSVTLAPSLSPSHSHSHPNTLATPSNPASPASNPIWRNWTNLRLSIKDRRANSQRHNSLSDTPPTPRTLRRQNRISSEHILRNADTLPGTWDPEECTEVYAGGLGASSRVVSDLDHFVCVGEIGDATPMGEHGSFSVGPLMSEPGGRDFDSVYSYGYGASEPAYPYLEIYNPSPAIAQNHNYNPPPANVNGTLTQQPRSSAAVTARADDIEPASPLTTLEDDLEDELVPIMGGFVRRMATIESFGSREAALSMARSRFSKISETPASPRSSLGWTPSMTSTLSKNASLGTAYYSVSSDLGMGSSSIKVNERGELEAKMTSPPSYSRYYYTRDTNRTTLSVPS